MVNNKYLSLKDFTNKSNQNSAIQDYNLERTINPYSGNHIYWCSEENDFCKNNWPNTFGFDYEIKKHIIEHAIHLPMNYGIIDCGAHIGDGTIPIADALIKHGRSDIKIYAIDPSPDKCKYIETIAKINNLPNIQVIQYGLSNTDGDTYSHAIDENLGTNTGGTKWHSTSEPEKIEQNQEIIKFIKLDTLVSNRVIDRNIGYIHFDVEGMEPQAILGGINLFARDKPIFSGETHTPEHTRDILGILSPLGYKFQEKNS